MNEISQTEFDVSLLLAFKEEITRLLMHKELSPTLTAKQVFTLALTSS